MRKAYYNEEDGLFYFQDYDSDDYKCEYKNIDLSKLSEDKKKELREFLNNETN